MTDAVMARAKDSAADILSQLADDEEKQLLEKLIEDQLNDPEDRIRPEFT